MYLILLAQTFIVEGNVWFIISFNIAVGQISGAIRLWNNANTSLQLTSGRVQIYYNNQWGSVCANTFRQDEADVVCRNLGYIGALNYSTEANDK